MTTEKFILRLGTGWVVSHPERALGTGKLYAESPNLTDARLFDTQSAAGAEWDRLTAAYPDLDLSVRKVTLGDEIKHNSRGEPEGVGDYM